jgi:hypothetical protein
MATLIDIRGLDEGPAGAILPRGFRVKSSAGTNAQVKGGATVRVDVDDSSVRKALRRNAGRYIVVSVPALEV